MKKIDLYIPIEIKKRDFASRALIGYLASLSFFNVFVGRKLEIDQLVFQQKAGIYFGLVTTEAYSSFYTKLKKYGHYIFVNDEEGLVTFSDDMYFNLKVSKKSLSKIDLLFLWSLTHKKMFTDRFPYKNKYIISGSPRYDFSKKNLINIFKNNNEFIKKKYKKYILICCSFSFANYYLKNTNYTKILQKQKVIKNVNDLKNFNKYLKYNKEALNYFIEAIEYLSVNNRSISIIIRPHPSENHEIYMRLAKKHTNVFVETDYSIHPWIINSECIVHNYCTSSSEALALGVPRFALRKTYDVKVHKSIPYEPSVICRNKEELASKIDDLFKNKIQFDNNQLVNNFKKYLHNIDQHTYASEIIVNNFINYFENNSFPKLNYIYFIFIKNLRFIKKFYRFFFKADNSNLEYIKHKVDQINVNDVMQLVKTFNSYRKDVDPERLKIIQYSKNIVNINYLKK